MMITKRCGCTTATCGCCEGTRKLTPVSTANRPGLPTLLYRVGTHGAFLETMKAGLASMIVEGVGPDAQTSQRFLPLQGLTTRDAGDPSIALLDGWATVADVLTFYQQMIANEGYLRTATERRSVLELGRLVGYALRPGVASTVYLAYKLDDKQVDPVEIPISTRAQSIPGPGELPQSFETIEKFVARPEWNNLQVRLTQPTQITLDNVLGVPSVYVEGTTTSLKAGDLVLFVFSDATTETPVLRTVAEAKTGFADNRTQVALQPVPPTVVAALVLLDRFVSAARALAPAAAGPAMAAEMAAVAPPGPVDVAEAILNQTRLGLGPPPGEWINRLKHTVPPPPEVQPLLNALLVDLAQVLGQPVPAPQEATTDPSLFVPPLLRDPSLQARSGLQLVRRIGESLQPGSDAHPQLLVNFAPRLQDSFYRAWANARLAPAPGGAGGGDGGPATAAAAPAASSTGFTGLYAFRLVSSLFGASVPNPSIDPATGRPPGKPLDMAGDEDEQALFLDQPREGILPGGYALIQTGDGAATTRAVLPVSGVQTVQRLAYTIGGKATRLAFDTAWWTKDLKTLRSTLVHAQTEALTLVEEPLPEEVEADLETRAVPLAGLHKELTSGRWVIFSGERADIPGVTGVEVSELLMISALRQDSEGTVPGRIHTTLILATPTAYTYKRSKLVIHGNVVKATHGETRNETLGNGDASQPRQSFELKQPPLTFVPDPNPSGVASTLKVYVNDVEWHEAPTLAGAAPTDRIFVTKTDDESKMTLVFGNGQQGSRLPTGTENVRAVYRNGIGKPGNVAAGQISMVVTKPLGVKEVSNPLRASGGADKESRDQARDNVALATMALDRVVSLQDYADFTRSFAGIGKAQARRLSDGRRELVHLTIAGAEDISIHTTGDLYRNLLTALSRYGDPDLPLEVQVRELVVLVLGAKVQVAADYRWEPVATRIRAALLDTFGFQRRCLGQPALLCEAIGCIQNVEGVAWLDVEAFGGIPEKKSDPNQGGRRLLTLEELAEAARRIVDPGGRSRAAAGGVAPRPGPAERVDANLAGFEDGGLRPAQLVCVLPAVPDTIVLNQVEARR